MDDLSSFPIKYAALNLKDINASDFDLYVAAKCYVVSETKTYLPNNQISLEYGIVFSWDKFNSKIYPTYRGNKCVNQTNTNHAFNELDEAIAYTRELNKNILINKMMAVPVKEMMAEKERLEKIINEAYKLEEKHYSNEEYVKVKKI